MQLVVRIVKDHVKGLDAHGHIPLLGQGGSRYLSWISDKLLAKEGVVCLLVLSLGASQLLFHFPFMFVFIRAYGYVIVASIVFDNAQVLFDG